MIKETLKENKNLALFLLVLVLGLPISLALAFWLAFYGRIFPKISVCQISLAGEVPPLAQEKLTRLILSQPLTIQLKYQERTFELNLSSLKYSPQETTQKAFGFGRNSFGGLDFKELVSLWRKGENLNLIYQLDQNELNTQIASVAAQVNLPAIDPQIKISQKDFQKTVWVENGEKGLEVDLPQLRQKINEFLACPSKEAVLSLPVKIVSSEVTEDMLTQTQKRAEAFLNKQITLQLDQQSWVVNDEELLSFLAFDGGFKKSKIREFVDNFAPNVDREPENALFQFANNRVEEFKPSQDGISLQKEELIDKLIESLMILESTQKNQEIALPVVRIPAKITTADVNNLGIKEIVGQGSSIYKGSDANRIHNLSLASLRLNGILIAPGEEFSFLKALGKVSTATGYKQAYIIKEGRTILGDGGGVCQVSTTLFRAALNTGLPITERQSHAYRVSYYEQDLGPGFDATVFDPSPDLKFINNTPSYLLLQTQIDKTNQKLIFSFYGTSDGRKVTLSKVKIWDQTPPPPDLYQDDPTLPQGTIKQIERKIWGAKTSFNYKVVRNGEVLTEQTFYSNYRPWQAVYLRGTKQ